MHQNTARYWIPPHIRACSALSSTVLLDLERNRYFGIGQKETLALSTLAINWRDAHVQPGELQTMPAHSAAPIAEALVDAGLLSRAEPEVHMRVASVDLNGALTSVGHQLNRSAALRMSHFGKFLAAIAWTRRALRARSLYSIARELSERKARAGAAFDEARAVELVNVFRRLRPHTFAAKDQCLFHALALVTFLSRFDLYPTWVIGVRPKPWAAHSWVQHGTLLLDAHPEQVCEYTPILAI